jgi:putative transcriptional regulator
MAHPELSSIRPGFLLVAHPELRDPNFDRAVVLMVSHDAEGAFGLVLNRPLDRPLSQLLDDVPPGWGEVLVLRGGPVETGVVQFLSGQEGLGRPVVSGVEVGADMEQLVAARPQGEGVRAFAGYSGWGSGQLESETREGTWIVTPAEPRHIFEIPADELWATVLRDEGGQYAWMTLTGGDPSQN